jgi:tetratricopeptide (TPR) repeat protein
MGYCKENLQIGKALLDYGNKHSNSRCLVLGHMSISFAHSVAGNPALALEASKEAVKASADPVYSIIPNSIAALSYFQMGEFKEAEKIARATLAFSEKYGCEFHGTVASIILDVVMIANGKMAIGLKRIEDLLQQLRKAEKKSFSSTGEHILGKIYFQIASGEGPLRLSTLLKNAVFLAKTLPIASKRAEYHFNKAIDLAKEIGAKGVEGQAYFDLGMLYKTKKKKDLAKQYISKAVQVFEETNAEVYLEQARQALESLS